ncbi:MAG: ATP-binding protein [Yoonia sp.]
MARFVPSDNDSNKVDASPTKSFFVSIITKDILLNEAIHDLVDNCVDGAKRLRPGIGADYTGLSVSITFGRDRFEVKDNCGGIPLDIARKYAFKFGRAEGFQNTSHSVGQFGIGMKRALFKFGNYFSVSSVEPNSTFKISVDVKDWVSDNVNWDFDLEGLEEKAFPADKTGTEICVTGLDPSVSSTFEQTYFEKKVRQEIRVKHQYPMRQGLQISVNGESIISSEWQLTTDATMSPAFVKYEDEIGGTAPLITRLYAGIGSSSKANAGWYVFCNGRCILSADQGKTTGWDDMSSGGTKIPKYHGQFARFRGYAFLDSDDASLLPWNTTKTDLDLESVAYRLLIARLIEITRPVIDFLNELDGENDLEDNDKILTHAVDAAPKLPLDRIQERPAFTYTAAVARGPRMATISYRKPRNAADTLKKEMSAGSYKELGEKTFDYANSLLVEDG